MRKKTLSWCRVNHIMEVKSLYVIVKNCRIPWELRLILWTLGPTLGIFHRFSVTALFTVPCRYMSIEAGLPMPVQVPLCPWLRHLRAPKMYGIWLEPLSRYCYYSLNQSKAQISSQENPVVTERYMFSIDLSERSHTGSQYPSRQQSIFLPRQML